MAVPPLLWAHARLGRGNPTHAVGKPSVAWGFFMPAACLNRGYSLE